MSDEDYQSGDQDGEEEQNNEEAEGSTGQRRIFSIAQDLEDLNYHLSSIFPKFSSIPTKNSGYTAKATPSPRINPYIQRYLQAEAARLAEMGLKDGKPEEMHQKSQTQLPGKPMTSFGEPPVAVSSHKDLLGSGVSRKSSQKNLKPGNGPVANGRRPSEYLKAAIKYQSKTDLDEIDGTRDQPNPAMGLMTSEIIQSLLRNQDVKSSLPSDVVQQLLSAKQNEEPLKDSTLQALAANKGVKELIGDLGLQSLARHVREVGSGRNTRSRQLEPHAAVIGSSSRSRSKGRQLDYKHPQGQFRNIEGVRPADTYYSKLYRQNSSKKTASLLYKPSNPKIVTEDRQPRESWAEPTHYERNMKSNRSKKTPFTRSPDRGGIMEAMRVLSKKSTAT